MPIATLGGMYGADSGTSKQTSSIGAPAPSGGMGTGVAVAMNPQTTPASAPAPISVISLLPPALANASFLGQGLPWWLGMLAFLALAKWSAEQVGKESEFGSIRVGLYNSLIIWSVWVITSNGSKFLAAKYRVGGLSDLILAA